MWLFVIRYVPVCFKTKQMCDKVLKNAGMLIFVPDCYKDQKFMMKLLIIIHMH